MSKSNSSGSEFSSLGPLQYKMQSMHFTGYTSKLHNLNSLAKFYLLGGISILPAFICVFSSFEIEFSSKLYEFKLSSGLRPYLDSISFTKPSPIVFKDFFFRLTLRSDCRLYFLVTYYAFIFFNFT